MCRSVALIAQLRAELCCEPRRPATFAVLFQLGSIFPGNLVCSGGVRSAQHYLLATCRCSSLIGLKLLKNHNQCWSRGPYKHDLSSKQRLRGQRLCCCSQEHRGFAFPAPFLKDGAVGAVVQNTASLLRGPEEWEIQTGEAALVLPSAGSPGQRHQARASAGGRSCRRHSQLGHWAGAEDGEGADCRLGLPRFPLQDAHPVSLLGSPGKSTAVKLVSRPLTAL